MLAKGQRLEREPNAVADDANVDGVCSVWNGIGDFTNLEQSAYKTTGIDREPRDAVFKCEQRRQLGLNYNFVVERRAVEIEILPLSPCLGRDQGR